MTEPQEEQQPLFWTDQDGEGEPTIWTGDRDHPKAVLRRCEIATDEQTRDELMRRVVAVEQPNVPGLSGAREALVEQLAEAIVGGPERARLLVLRKPGELVNARRDAEAVLPLVEAHVAAEVEAAVSVVRAERDEAREEVRARDDDAALDVERVKRGGRELGRILDRTLSMALEISGRQDVIDKEGDGDWALVWETLAELRPRAESAESDLRALRQKVAKVEALHADLAPSLRHGTPMCSHCRHPLPCPTLVALSDPTTPDQKGGE